MMDAAKREPAATQLVVNAFVFSDADACVQMAAAATLGAKVLVCARQTVETSVDNRRVDLMVLALDNVRGRL